MREFVRRLLLWLGVALLMGLAAVLTRFVVE